jgi:GH18 family chitinase
MDFFVEGVLGFEKVHATLMDKMASVYNIMSYAKMGKWDMVLAEHAKLLDPPLENAVEKASTSRRYLSGAEIASLFTAISQKA